jgi:putative FmdB family regulatory protein
MPTYEYACQKCGHEFEQFQSMRDEPLKKCPRCKKAGLKRLVGSGAGLIFKGTGFYITDYKNKSSGKKEEGGGDKGGGESKSGGDAKPSESKPAASESKPATSESKPGTASSSASKSSRQTGKK